MPARKKEVVETPKEEKPKKEEELEPNPVFLEMEECFKYLDEQLKGNKKDE